MVRNKQQQVKGKRFCALCLAIFLLPAIHALTQSNHVTLIPVQVELDKVSFQYPDSWLRKLTSAGPRREYALRDVSLVLSNRLTLLTGDSDCGKTTLFKIILGTLQPTDGTVRTVATPAPGERDYSNYGRPVPMPICLDLLPDSSQTSLTTRDMLLKTLQMRRVQRDVASAIVDHLCQIVGYSDAALEQKRHQLATSDNYKLDILLASIESICGTKHNEKAPSFSNTENMTIPAPVLLLDEWLDKETSTVIHRIQESLCSLGAAGAVVCVITHRPERWNQEHGVVRVRLRKGRRVE